MADILISGYYGFNNIGDDAILRTVVENLKTTLPDSRITVMSNAPEDTREKYGVEAVPRMRLGSIIKAVRACDILISGGGSLLQDVTGPISILYYLFIIRLALIFGKRVFIYSQGIGPIRGRLNRFLTGRILRKVEAIAVRDEASASFLTGIGVPEEKITVTADPVLRLPRADLSRGREILESLGLEKKPGRRIVGWALKADSRYPGFLDEVEKAIRQMSMEEGTDCVLIPFHYEQDIPAIVELSRRLGPSVYAVTDKHLSDEMLSVIGNLDLLVGVRLHSLIYAAVMGVPMMGISYDPKIDAFLSSVGLKPISATGDFTASAFMASCGEAAGPADPEKTAELIKRLNKNDELLKAMADSDPAPVKTGGKVGGIIGAVMLITVLAKMFGILRESAQAGVFGAADAFYAAYNKTIYLYTTIAYAMCVAAVPIMTKAIQKDRREGVKTSNSIITLSLIISVIGTAGWILATFIPGSGEFWGGSEAAGFTRIMALSLPIIVMAYMMVAILQAMDHYALQGSMSLPYSIFLIVYLLLFDRRLPLWAYVAAVSLAWVLQLAMCLPYTIKEKYAFRPTLLKGDYMLDFVKTGFVTVITNSMYLFCYLLDASRAARIGEGVTSAFYYADKLFTPLTTTFIYSISAVMFPRLNREYTKNSKGEYLSYVWQLVSNTLVIVFPMAALLIVFGEPILKVLFESGSFTAENTAQTASIFVMYALGMAGFSAIDILSKAFFAMEKRIVPLFVSLGVVATNFLLNAVFGVTGAALALTTAGSLTIGAAVTVLILFKGERVVDLRDIIKSAAASIVMGAAAYGLKLLLVDQTDGKIMLVVKCGLIGAVMLVVFAVMAIALKMEALNHVLRRKKQ